MSGLSGEGKERDNKTKRSKKKRTDGMRQLTRSIVMTVFELFLMTKIREKT